MTIKNKRQTLRLRCILYAHKKDGAALHMDKAEGNRNVDFVSVCLYFLVQIIIVIFYDMATTFVSFFILLYSLEVS